MPVIWHFGDNSFVFCGHFKFDFYRIFIVYKNMLNLHKPSITLISKPKKMQQAKILSLFSDSSFEPVSANDAETGESVTAANSYREESRQDDEQQTPATHPDKAQTPSNANQDVRWRNKSKRIRVSFSDGTVVCESRALSTLMKVIVYIGVERVAGLGMVACHQPLLTKGEYPQKYRGWVKDLPGGWHLLAQSDTAQKFIQLKSIVRQLGLDAKVEYGDFEASLPEKRNVIRRKAKMSVRFAADGHTIEGYTGDAFRATVEHIGIDKVKRTNLIVLGSKRIITPSKSSNDQVQLSTGEWLTIPSQIRDKIKVLNVMSLLTRVKFDVSIDK